MTTVLMSILDQDGWTTRKRTFRLVDGRSLVYIDTGGPGPTLLLLHGYSDSSRSFSLLEPWLAGYRLIIPDLPGHGGSGVGTGLTVPHFTDDIVALVTALSMERFAVIGHSMGAMISIAVAARLPDVVTALITISGSVRPAFPRHDPVTNGILGLCDPIDPGDPFFKLWHSCPHAVDPCFLAAVSREAAAIPAEIWHGILACFSTLDLTETGVQVTAPALCIGGSEDALFGATHRLALEDALPKAQSVLMEGFGHNPHWEDSEKVSIILRDFFRDHSCL
ncbi:alpha/beta hydrolase [Rhizobium leguminosarum]|uniref:alpha/beta hydrolase n=1 Tax=Rhizobium leguminosarum TaxID=384 RepID=UPI001FDEB3D7|nr:alpha/beta hydrolase [Rhizobium leguminosarum]